MEVQQSVPFWSELQSIIVQGCEKFDDEWRVRRRTLDTQFLVLFIFKLVLSKNKQGYNSTLCELWGSIHQSDDLTPPQENPVAASSICEARQKMPETIFQKLNQEIIAHWEESNVGKTWCGHRVFAADGSKMNLPTLLIKEGYKIQDENRQHYPVGLLSVLYNLGEGMAYDFVLQPHLDERLCAIEHMDKMSKGDVLVLDRGYFSYLLLYKSIEKGVHIVCRMPQKTVNGEIAKFWDSKEVDSIIEYYPSRIVQADLKKRGFDLTFKKIQLRLLTAEQNRVKMAHN